MAETEYITIGVLGRPHGVRGQIKCHPESFDLNRHSLLKKVFVNKGNKVQELLVESSVLAGRDWIFKFKEFDTPESVSVLTNGLLQITFNERLSLPEGKYYYSDFPGFSVVDENSSFLGEVLELIELPSVKAFAIKVPAHGEILLPWVDDCIKNIDVQKRTIFCIKEFFDSLISDNAGNIHEN